MIMYKKLILLVAFFSLSSVLAFGQKQFSVKQSKYVNLLTGNSNNTVKIKRTKLNKSAQQYLKAIRNRKIKTIYTYMNPVFVTKLGGKEKALDFIKSELKDIGDLYMIASLNSIDENLKRESNEPFNRLGIKIKTTSQGTTEQIEMNGYLIPIPSNEDAKQKIYFLHAEGILTSLTPSNCNVAYGAIPTKTNLTALQKPKSGSGPGIGTGSGRGSGDGSGRGSDSIKKVKNPSPPKPKTIGKTAAMKILSYPKPEYTFLAKLNNVGGTVRLRVAFLKNGKIGSVSAIKGLPCGLTQKAITTAKQLKFTPAMRKGKAYSITKVMQYSFSSSGSNRFEDYLK